MSASALPHEALCRSIVEAAQDAIVFADRDGVIRLWNAGAETIFGYPAEQALGQTLDLIIPENLRARHWEGYRRVMASGATRYGRELLKVPALRRDGARISLEFTVVPVWGASGEIFGVGAIIRDVTERWQQDRALRERLAALEAKERTSGASGGRGSPASSAGLSPGAGSSRPGSRPNRARPRL